MRLRLAAVCLPLALLALLTPAVLADPPGQRAGALRLVGAVRDLPSQNLSDLSFWGERMVVGYGITEAKSGFALLDIADPSAPKVLSTVDCAGTTNDVTLYADLVLVSVDGMEHPGPRRCGGAATDRAAGLRVFSVADPMRPVEVTDIVQTCTGAHNHNVQPDLDHVGAGGRPDPRLLVYVMNGSCLPADTRGLPGRAIEVIEVPLAHPQDARVLDVPLTLGPAEGGCHDMQVFAPEQLALMACTTGGQLWDVSDPARPAVLAADLDRDTPESHKPSATNVNSYHSGAFSLDGDVLVVGEESGGGLLNACNGADDQRGMLRFYDVSDPKNPVYRSSYKIEERVLAQACTPHLFGVVNTLDGRRLFTVAWMGGGVRLLDATDPARVRELASYEPGGTAYTAYEYRGHVYVSYGPAAFAPLVGGAGGRGLEVLELDGITTRQLDSLDPQVQQVSSRRRVG